MTENVFNFFGDTSLFLRQTAITPISKKLITSNENIGKLSGVHKSVTHSKTNQFEQKGATNSKIPLLSKKSFLANKGTAIQVTPSTPATPLGRNFKKPLMIYTDSIESSGFKTTTMFDEEVEFHKPCLIFDNFTRDILDDDGFSEEIFLDNDELLNSTVEPEISLKKDMSFNSSYGDVFEDDLSCGSLITEEPNFDFSFN